jgi:hypothetical protein
MFRGQMHHAIHRGRHIGGDALCVQRTYPRTAQLFGGRLVSGVLLPERLQGMTQTYPSQCPTVARGTCCIRGTSSRKVARYYHIQALCSSFRSRPLGGAMIYIDHSTFPIVPPDDVLVNDSKHVSRIVSTILYNARQVSHGTDFLLLFANIDTF